MTIIEQEIMSQHEALQQTCRWFDSHAGEVSAFMRGRPYRQMLFLGCGSSYMLARSGAILFGLRTNLKTTAVAGGDFLIDPESYSGLLTDALVVVLTRSGQTSEINLAVDQIRSLSDAAILCIHTRSGTAIPAKSDFAIPLDWGFDRSVCQTRTISVFYCALVALYAQYSGDAGLMRLLKQVVDDNEAYKQHYRPLLAEIGQMDWQQVVVLADAELAGIAQEGALAFGEICLKHGAHYPLLDFRHGPAVLADQKTLFIAVIRPENLAYQLDLVSDLRRKGSAVICLSELPAVPQANWTVQIPAYGDFAVWGIPFIFLPQMIALTRAFADHHDPDHPEGLDPYIVLPPH